MNFFDNPIFAGFTLGFMVGSAIHLLPGTDLSKYRDAKEQCEKSLPRDQHCKVMAIQEDVK